jgi:hypothetical protein
MKLTAGVKLNGLINIFNLFMIMYLHHKESLSINESNLFEVKPRIYYADNFHVLPQTLQFAK